jgi:hypothetical protein
VSEYDGMSGWVLVSEYDGMSEWVLVSEYDGNAFNSTQLRMSE